MSELVFHINGQGISLESASIKVADTINYFSAKFNFTEDWTGHTKYLHLQYKGDTFVSEIDSDDEIKNGLDFTDGTYIAWIHGERYEGENLVSRITTNKCSFSIQKSGILNGEPFPELSESIGEKVVRESKEARDTAVEAAQSAQNASDHVDLQTTHVDAQTEHVDKTLSEITILVKQVNEDASGVAETFEAVKTLASEASTAAQSASRDAEYVSEFVSNIESVKEDIKNVREVAAGKTAAYVFDTKEDLDLWLTNPMVREKLKIGDNLLIRALDTPDYWWDGSDIQFLETEKMDLSEYAKKSQIPTAIAQLQTDAYNRTVTDDEKEVWYMTRRDVDGIQNKTPVPVPKGWVWGIREDGTAGFIKNKAGGGVAVSEEEPTDEDVNIWIHTSRTTFDVPEIKDDVISEEDTWSSKKIDGEIKKVGDELTATKESLRQLESAAPGTITGQLSESIVEISDAVEDVNDAVTPIIECDNLIPQSIFDIVESGYILDGEVVQDAKYGCSNPFQLFGGKTYSIGLVPAFGIATTPWFRCPNGITFYNSKMEYVGQSVESVVKAPISAKYARLNISKDSGLSVGTVKTRAVMVLGETLPSSFIPYNVVTRDLFEELDSVTEQIADINSFLDETLKSYTELHLSKSTGAIFSIATKDFYYGVNGLYSVIQNEGYKDIIVSSDYVNKNAPIIVYFNGIPSKSTYMGYDNGGASTDSYTQVSDYVATIPNGCTHILIQSAHSTGYLSALVNKPIDFSQLRKTIFCNITDDIITVSTPFGERKLSVTFGKRGVNNLPDFRTIMVDEVYIYNNATDWHAPMIVRAVNNADGDHPTSTYFTGGNHSFTNTGTGVPSARCESLKYYVDGKQVNNFDGECSNVRAEWVNLVTGYNTEKEDGTGREIIKEIHKLSFDGYEWTSEVSLIPLEDVVMQTWYGFQCSGTASEFPNIRYIGGENRGLYRGNTTTSSGNKECNLFRAYGDLFGMDMELDPTIDLGDRKYYTGTKGCFNNDYGKGYFNIVENKPMATGDMYSIRGYYRFYPV